MNMFKKLVVAATFLCAATVVNAQDVEYVEYVEEAKDAGGGMRIGTRFEYSMQSVAYGMGMLGLRLGLDFDFPIGPIFLSPEVAFLYRNNWSATGNLAGKAVDWTQHEYAVSVPITIKFFLGLTSVAIGPQVDIPFAAEECFGDDCRSADGKGPNFTERAKYDVGIALSFGYTITPYLVFDLKCVYGLTPHHTYKEPPTIGEIKSPPMSSYGFGLTYFFL